MKQVSAWTITKLWLAYFFPFLPAVPRIGREEEGDCVFAQSFGRNGISDDRLGKTIFRLRTQANLDDVEAFILLKQSGFDLGKPNMALARESKKLSQKYAIPVFGQWEVMFGIFLSDMTWYIKNQERMCVIWPPEEDYFATFHVKILSCEKMKQRGLSRPIELAHPAMIARAVPVIWRTGASPIVGAVSIFNFWKHPLWVWDDKSIQWWVKNFQLWLVREPVGRLEHFRRGWVALSPPA